MVRKTARSKPARAKPVRQKASRNKRARKKPARKPIRPAKAQKPRRPGPPNPAPAVPPAWTNAEIAEGFRRFAAANPEPVGELQYITPFTLLVAVVLSAQATDASVNKATPALFAVADTPARMIELGEAKVSDYIKTIGLYRTKAKNLIALSQQLIAQHGGEVPRTREALEALPGVGRKTANVVLNIAFGEPTIAVDTHIFRIANRTGLATGATPFEVETKLEERVPARYKRHAHHWLILHGRYVCMARAPRCDKCLIVDLCKWPAKAIHSPGA